MRFPGRRPSPGLLDAPGTALGPSEAMMQTKREPTRLNEVVEETQAELRSTLGALRGAVGESLDWRAFVRRHPLAVLVASAWIGLRLGRGRWT
jgi:hypothetical protein